MSRLDRDLMGLPWGYVGPRLVVEDGMEHWEIQIRELPDFFVAGATRDEVLNELRPALRAFLESYLARGETPPLPEDIDRWRVEVTEIVSLKLGEGVLQNPSDKPGATIGGLTDGQLISA